MEPWQTITVAILGNATALAVIGWLGKSLLEKLIQRDSKRFEIELRAKADSAIETLKNDLQIRTIEHQVRFSKLHEKRATVIADLNGLLVEALWEAESFLSPMQWAGDPGMEEKHQSSMTKLVALYRFFDKHKIYLPEALCGSLGELIQEIRLHVINLGCYLPLNQPGRPDHVLKDQIEISKAGWHAIKNQIPDARKKLEDEFRDLLGQRT